MRKLINAHTEHRQEHMHEHIIEISNLSFRYHSKKENTLKNISLNIHRGYFTTIIGANGSGKSTLVKNIVRLLKFQEGELHVNGVNANEYKAKDYAKKIAYIPQQIEIPEGITVQDFVSFGRTPYLSLMGNLTEKDHAIVEKAMRELHIYDWKDQMTNDLSGGQRQRVVVAMAVAQEADIIILDEPTTYLDVKAQYEILELMDILHDQGKTVVAILHDINQAIQYSDEIVVMKSGEVYAQGKPEVVITQKMLIDVFGVDAELSEVNKKKFIMDIKIVK